MCLKADDITNYHKWEAGDFGYWPENGDINVMYFGEYSPEELGEGHLWLPRQDQLQEMVKGDKHMHLLAYEFASYFHGTTDPLYAYLGQDNFTVDADNSMEQMWLAYVMNEKYGKVWDGTEWVKSKCA